MGRALELLAECPEAQRGWEWHYLDRLCHAEQRVLDDIGGESMGLAYSQDGRWQQSFDTPLATG